MEADWRASADWEEPAWYVGGTTVPEPNVSSVSTAEVASMAGIGTWTVGLFATSTCSG